MEIGGVIHADGGAEGGEEVGHAALLIRVLQAYPEQVWLPAGPSGGSREDRGPTGGEAVRKLCVSKK